MASIDVSESVKLELPDSVQVRQRPAGRRSRARLRSESDGLDMALENAGLEVEAELELVPATGGAASNRRRTRSGDGPPAAEVPPAVEVRVAPDEGALLLLETDGGVFAWVEPASERSSRRGGPRTLTFSLAGEQGGSTRRGRRGRRGVLSWLGDRLVEPIRVRVLRFVATEAIERLVDQIEGDRPFGLVDMAGSASTWLPGASLPTLGPDPARILLMIHGTFSTTIGGFSALEVTDSGQAFLKDARSKYDAVLGFDHPTLGADPEQNAAALMAVLQALPQGTRIDSVAHSRGGLVLRTLIERLAPAARPDLSFERAVFVACTNGGTNLANPENWRSLVDLYTNIVMAGARALALVSGGTAAAIVTATVSTIARFVKLLPQIGVEEGKVPGLAAMLPGGPFVDALNSGPGSGGTDYYVVASDFEPRIEPSKGLTGELTEYLVDRLADRLFQGDNDLVVHTSSMWEFGTSRPGLDPGKLHVIPTDETVYHIIYFASEKVGELLAGWILPEGGGEKALPAGAGEPDPDLGPAVGSSPGGGGWSDDSGDGGEGFADRDLGGGFADRGLGGGFADRGLGDGGFGGRGSDGGGSADRVKASFDRSIGDPGDFDEGFPGRGSPPPVEPRSGRRMRGGADPAPAPPAAAGEAGAAGRAECHFAAEMQPTPPLGVPVPLFVTVSPERIVTVGGAASAATPQPVAVDRSRPIEIEILTGRNCGVVGADEAPRSATKREPGPALKEIPVPDGGAVSLRFEIEGFAPGEAEIFVEVRQGPRLLASFLLKPVFTLSSEERLSVSQVARLSESVEDEPAVLRIHEMHLAHGSLRLRFELSSENPNIFIGEDVDLSPNFNLAAFVGSFLAKLENAYDLDDYEGTLRRIRDFSIVSTNGLIPEKVRAELWNHREKIRAIQVISENPLIPWELLYITDPAGRDEGRDGFLSEWGLVRWMYNARWPSRHLRLRDDNVFYVIPDYLDRASQLKGAQAERDMLRGRFAGASAVEASSTGVADFLRARGGECDLLHFACHGEAKQEAVLSSDLVMTGFNRSGRLVEDLLAQETVKVGSNFGEDAPSGIVFVNACQTGRTGEGIAGVMGFADSFLRPNGGRGANAFIGALWSIDDKLALTFADTLYEGLLAGDTLIESIGKAREACKADRDFTWLAYSIYGHPFARIVPPDAES